LIIENNDAVGWRDWPGWYLGELSAMQGCLNKMDFDIIAFGHGMPEDKTPERLLSGFDYPS